MLATAGDTVVEGAGGGTNLVKAGTSYTLGLNVENLLLTGSAQTNGSGNGLANTLTGNASANTLKGLDGNDVLNGGAGVDRLEGGASADTLNGGAIKDTLVGGLGNDAFVFTSLAEVGDAIADFHNVAGDNDLIRIDASSFGGGLVEGRPLAASQFRARADNLAQDADDWFIFATEAPSSDSTATARPQAVSRSWPTCRPTPQ